MAEQIAQNGPLAAGHRSAPCRRARASRRKKDAQARAGHRLADPSRPRTRREGPRAFAEKRKPDVQGSLTVEAWRQYSKLSKWDLTVDVVAVGSGLGGMTAAIVAHDAGKKALVLEKAPKLGGVSAYSGGEVFLPLQPPHGRPRASPRLARAPAWSTCASSRQATPTQR